MRRTQGVKTSKYGVTDEELKTILEQSKARVLAVGVGGAGGNVANLLFSMRANHIEVMAINTDAQDLLKVRSDIKLLIGKSITGGLGAGSDPIIGEAAAKENFEEIKEALGGSDLVFLIAGLGGGTGTGASPIVAKAARETGAIVVSIVFFPFSVEGAKRQEIALEGIRDILSNSDAFLLVQNDKILELKPNISINEGIEHANRMVVDLMNNLVKIIRSSSLINVDFADIRTVLEEGGVAAFFSNKLKMGDKTEDIAKDVLSNPLLEVDISGGKKALIFVEAPPGLEIERINEIIEGIVAQLDPKAHVIWGADLTVNQGSSEVDVFSFITGVKLKGIELEERAQVPKPRVDLGLDLESL